MEPKEKKEKCSFCKLNDAYTKTLSGKPVCLSCETVYQLRVIDPKEEKPQEEKPCNQ